MSVRELKARLQRLADNPKFLPERKKPKVIEAETLEEADRLLEELGPHEGPILRVMKAPQDPED